jgi:hypothetical protein
VKPEDLVNLQLSAYNNRDIDAFVATYATDVRVFEAGESEPIFVGTEAIRQHYGTKTFTREGLNATILSRMVVGNKVVDHERTTWTDRPTPYEILVVYEVADDLIRNVWFFEPAQVTSRATEA